MKIEGDNRINIKDKHTSIFELLAKISIGKRNMRK